MAKTIKKKTATKKSTVQPKVWKLDEGHVVVPAFVSNNVQYFMVKDTFNTFCMRALTGIAAYEEWGMRCDRSYLEQFNEAFDLILNDPTGKINITDLVRLKLQLSDRLDFALPSMDIVYRFASVVFFDENESPYKYDESYCKEKIERWKSEMDLPAFFLTVPIKTLIPLPDISDNALTGYYKVLGKIDQKHLNDLHEIISSRQRKTATTQA